MNLFAGVIDVDEIMYAFRELGMQIERPEAERLLRRYVTTCTNILLQDLSIFKFCWFAPDLCFVFLIIVVYKLADL